MIHVIELQAEAMRAVTALNKDLTQLALAARHSSPEDHEQPPKPKRAHQPQNPELRDWTSCRKFFQRWEAKVRRDLNLKPDDPLEITVLATACELSVKTIRRIMFETYHLRRDQWPPSTWPEDLPPR